MYLAGHTKLSISYTANFTVRYMLCLKLVHKHALKQIGRYLKATSNKALIIKPSKKLLNIDSFPVVNGAGMYRHEAMDDPIYVKSRNQYMIMVAMSYHV